MEARLSEIELRDRAPCVLRPAPARAPSFVVAVRWTDGGVPVVSVTGELDLATAAALERPLLELCDAPTGPVIVDLTSCAFIDLRGLHVLLRAQETLERSKQPLVLVMQQPLLRILQVTRVDALFHVRPSLREAVEGYDARE